MKECSRKSFIASAAALCAAASSPASSPVRRPLRVSPIREGGVGDVLKVTELEIRVGAVKSFCMLHAS